MYYPYHEGRAGKLRTQRQTTRSSEYLLADSEIVTLAREILTEEQYLEAEEISGKLAGKKRERDLAKDRLLEIVKPPPKRPLYYAQEEITLLPRWTRDALRDLGDFIDLLVKSAVYEKTHDKRSFNLSLGPAIDLFQKLWPTSKELANLLRRYNRFLYRGAKHDFTLPAGRTVHRFTSREVVLTSFITMNLADKITSISQLADKARHDQEII
jgi:hypothetical protein